MSAKKKNQFTSFALFLCAGGLTIVVAGLVYLYAAPKVYQATAKVKLVKSGWNTNSENSFGLERLPGECQVIRSDNILDRAITNLNLNTLWGKQFNQGVPLTTEQASQRLKTILDVHPAPNSILIKIQANGSDPFELASIVNEITKLYCDVRQAGREKASHQGIDSLRAQWEAQSRKVENAQAALDKLAYEFNMERATNSVRIYDSDAVQALQAQRLTLADDYLTKSNQLAKLKQLDREELKNVLSTVDSATNSVLTGALQQLLKANKDLREAQTAHGADAPETKSAALVVQELNRRVDGLVDSTMSARELELSLLKATLDRTKGMAEKASHPTNEEARFADQDKTFAKARDELLILTEQRDAQEREISGNGSMSAVMPDVITARVVELADPPVKPVSPDGRVTLEACVAGGTLTAAGLLLLALLRLKPRGAEQKTR